MAEATITYRTTSGSSHGSRTPSRRVTMSPNKPQSPLPAIRGPTPDNESVKSMERRWKTYHDETLMNKLADKRVEKKESSQISKQKARNLARKIPVELLAKEWLKDNKATVETRAFMVDKVLPTLILGIEKLLIEADGKGLTLTNEHDSNFNPINFLAQYLMRNNPRFSNFSEASPYIRGLREVHEELKKQLFDYEENRLARIKAEAKTKRERREDDLRLKKVEKQRREDCLKKQFLEWNVGYDGRIELTLLQNALRSFVEVTEHFPEELRKAAQLSHELEPTDESGRTMTLKEFAKYLQKFIDDMPSEVFDQFLIHMSRCALTFRAAAQREQRRISLTNLFVSCDHSGIGLLDRHRILNLFEKFYDACKEEHRGQLTNPRGWPVVEVDEAIVSDYSDDEDEPTPKTPSPGDSDALVTPPSETGLNSKPGSASSIKPTEEQSGTEEQKLFKTESDAGIELSPKASEEDVDGKEDEKKDAEKTAMETTAPADTEAPLVVETTEAPTETPEMTPPSAAEPVEASTKPVEEPTEPVEATAKPVEEPTEPVVASTKSVEEPTEPVEATAKPVEEPTEPVVASTKPVEEPTEQVEATSKPTEVPTEPVQATSEPDQVSVAKEDSGVVDEEKQTAAVESEEKPLMAEDGNEVPDEKPAEAPIAPEQAAVTSAEQTSDNTEMEKSKPTETTPVEGTAASEEKPVENLVEKSVEKPVFGSDLAEPATLIPKPSVEVVVETVADAEESAVEEGGLVKKDTVSEKELQADQLPEKDLDESKEKVLVDGEKEDKVNDVPLPTTPPKTSMEMLPPPTRGASVSFEEGTVFEKERSLLVTRGSGSQSQMSAFDETTVNVSQFVQVTENFLGELPPQDIFQNLVKFLRDGYVETEEEKMQRLVRAHREAQSAKRKFRVDHLFEKWDNDGSGYLDLDEIETIMTKYKDGQEKQAVQEARLAIKKKNPAHDSRLSKREFREFIQFVIEEIPGADTFEFFVEFLEGSVERTYAERIRGEARKKWLQMIVNAAETGGASMEPIYRAVFQALYKDAETHGNGKVISANITMLEANDLNPERGDTVLRYVASTPDDGPYLLGKSLYKDMKGISFSAVENGKPIHVPRVNNHGNIMFWRHDRNMEESDGSFIVVPLKDRLKRVFGTLGVDTLNDPHTKAIFITHEIQFFQGIAKAFSIAYHHVDNRRKTMTITESAVSWIHRRSPHVLEISVYMVEPDGKDEDYVLRRMMTTDHKGEPQAHPNPPRLERKDNLFRDYLFKCVDNSETVTADAYGQRHFAFPLRDSNGMAVAIVDLSTGETKTLPKYERKEILHMLKLLQTAQKEITRESASGEKTAVLEAEMQHEDSRAEIMFDRLMLMDLKENVNKLDTRAYAELKSYKDPPKFVQNILKATLSLFYLDRSEEGEFDDWNNSKLYLNTDLNQKIAAYDPTKDGASMPFDKLSEPLDDVPHGAVAKHSSVPAEYLYNWVFACLSLIQHTQRMKKNKTN